MLQGAAQGLAGAVVWGAVVARRGGVRQQDAGQSAGGLACVAGKSWTQAGASGRRWGTVAMSWRRSNAPAGCL